MRWPRVMSLLLLLLSCCAASPAAWAPGPADGPGCIGVPLDQCLTWLRATMVLNERFVAESMARRHQPDVNGRPLDGGVVAVDGLLPERPDAFVILLHLQPDDTVRSTEASLLHNPITARTEAVYDSTALYPLAWRLLGRRCPSLGKLELYRFFENQVKPRIAHRRIDFSSGLSGLHRIYSYAAPVPFCGVHFSFTNRLEWRGAHDPEAAAKKTQFSSFELQ